MGMYIGGVLTGTDVVNFLGLKTGVKVPGYRSIIGKGGNAVSPYAIDVYEVKKWKACETSFRYHPNANPTVKISGSFGGKPSFVTPYPAVGVNNSILTIVDNKALASVYKKIRESRTGTNGLLFMAELRKTLHMLRNPAQAFVKSVEGLCDSLTVKRFKIANNPKFKGRKLTAREKVHRRELMVQAAQGSWLEFVYGVRPLVNDISDISETIYKKLTGPSPRTRARSYFEDSASQTTVSVTSVPSNNYPVSVNWLRDFKTTVGVQYICGLKTDVASNADLSAKTLAQDFGFTIENFVPTLYELIPYSFLFDYVSNLGDVISAVCTTTDNVVWVSKTTRIIDYNLHNVVPDKPINVANMVANDRSLEAFTGIPFTCEVERRRITREDLRGLPWPSVQLSKNLLDSPLHIANCIALLGNQRSKQFKF
jgi:hypothetical protein